MTNYGPHNPHPLSQMRTELVWEGKYDEFGDRREVNMAGLAMPLRPKIALSSRDRRPNHGTIRSDGLIRAQNNCNIEEKVFHLGDVG